MLNKTGPSTDPWGKKCYCASHKIRAWLRLEWISGVICFNTSAQAGPPTASCPGPCPDCIWMQGWKSNSLRKLLQCLVSLTVQKCFLMFRQGLLCFGFCTLPLVLSLGTTEVSFKFIKLIKHDFPLVNQCWLLLMNFISFMCLGSSSQDCLLHHLSRDGLQFPGSSFLPWVLFLALCENSSDLCFPVVFRNFPHLPWSSKHCSNCFGNDISTHECILSGPMDFAIHF